MSLLDGLFETCSSGNEELRYFR